MVHVALWSRSLSHTLNPLSYSHTYTHSLTHSLYLLGDHFPRAKTNLKVEADPEFPNQPADPDQWIRLIWPLFIHAGLIHVILAMLVQFFAGKQIERQAGALRTILIYFISGIGGYVVSGIFTPNRVAVGADPAIYGLVGVLLVELFQAWPVSQRRIREGSSEYHPISRTPSPVVCVVLIASSHAALPWDSSSCLCSLQCRSVILIVVDSRVCVRTSALTTVDLRLILFHALARTAA